MPDMREGDLGTAACYLTVERLALQAGVESPFWDEASLLMGGCEEPWYKKPLTPRRLRLFLKRYGGSLADDAGRRGHAAFVFSDVMHLHGIPLGGGADGLGALYVRRAESVAMTVAFLATGCTLADMAAITGLGEEAVAVDGMDTVYSLEVWVPDGEQWRWSAIGAYPTLDMAVAVGEGFLSVKPYRVRRVTDVGDGFHDFLAEEVFANALTGRMRLLREKFGHKGRG